VTQASRRRFVEPGAQALARVLMPLVRLLIARGITYQATAEVLQRVYVLAARKRQSRRGGDRHAPFLTGLNRKEIKRLTDGEPSRWRWRHVAAAAHTVWTSNVVFAIATARLESRPVLARRQPRSTSWCATSPITAQLLEELVHGAGGRDPEGAWHCAKGASCR
jgi:hypothetical protein